jgi:prepilin-type N-terminal cleavage/methylation domain-containing protein
MFQLQKNYVKKINCSPAGYSLIEVLIAMAIFAIGILAVFSMQIQATNSNALAKGITETNTAAADKVEELLALAYDHADLDVGVHNAAMDDDGIDNDGNGIVDDASDNSGYITLSWQVFPERTVWDQNIKSVRVSITSNVGGRRQKEIHIDFFVADI